MNGRSNILVDEVKNIEKTGREESGDAVMRGE